MDKRLRFRTISVVLIALNVTGTSWANPEVRESHVVHAAMNSSPIQLSLPEPPLEVVATPRTVVVDGEDWQRDLALWAVNRFDEAGLALPDVDISFHATSADCSGFAGMATTGTSPAEVRVCRRGARKVLLHELAHVWAHELPGPVRQSFVEVIGAASWNTDGEWHEHASEHAAETIAWVLLEGNNRPYTSSFDGFESVDSLAAFELLTGRAIPNWDGDITTPWDTPGDASKPAIAAPERNEHHASSERLGVLAHNPQS